MWLLAKPGVAGTVDMLLPLVSSTLCMQHVSVTWQDCTMWNVPTQDVFHQAWNHEQSCSMWKAADQVSHRAGPLLPHQLRQFLERSLQKNFA